MLNQLLSGEFPTTVQLLKLNELGTNHFLQQENLINVHAPLVVISDLHGQLYELQEILQIADPSYNFIFLGDLVDRCKWSIEVLSVVLCLVLLRPNNVHLIRGNHEDACIASQYSFYHEIFQKITDYPQDYVRSCCKLFDSLPLAAYEPTLSVFFVHGGLSPFIQKLEQINHLYRLQQCTYASQTAITDLLWSDPSTEIDNFSRSQRNSGVQYGYNACKKFCYENGLVHIFRGHQCQPLGYKIFFNDMLTSLWSAAEYTDTPNCLGAICMLEQSGDRQYILYQKSGQYDNRDEIWTEKEVACLVQYIKQYKSENKKISWKRISQILKNKSPRQCYDFYLNHRDGNDNISLHNPKRYHQWTDQEREKLRSLTEKNIDWERIKTAFPDFNINQLKNQIRQINNMQEKQLQKNKRNKKQNKKKQKEEKQKKQESQTNESSDNQKQNETNSDFDQIIFTLRNMKDEQDTQQYNDIQQASLSDSYIDQQISSTDKKERSSSKPIYFLPLDGKDSDPLSYSSVTFLDLW